MIRGALLSHSSPYHVAYLLTKPYYKNFIKNVKAAQNCDTNFFLIRPYLWYNWHMKKH